MKNEIMNMNTTIMGNIQARLATIAGNWVIFSARPTLFLSVITLAIWSVFTFILSSCNRAVELVRIYAGPFYGPINLAAYCYIIYTAGQWMTRRVTPVESDRKHPVGASHKGAQAKANAKVDGGGVRTGTDKGIVAMCYTNGVFDHAKAAQFMEDIDQAVRMNTVLNHLMNPDLQKSLEGIRADTPIREFHTTFDTLKRKTSELAGV